MKTKNRHLASLNKGERLIYKALVKRVGHKRAYQQAIGDIGFGISRVWKMSDNIDIIENPLKSLECRE